MNEKDWIGVWSKPVMNIVEKGAVRKFAEAIGDLQPLYYDEAYAKTTRFKRLLAPPTFSRTFDYGEVEGFKLDVQGLIHGEQTIHFERPIFVGDELVCSQRLTDVSVRTSASGKMTFYVYEQRGVSPTGELVFSERMTVIRKEGTEG